MATYDARPRAGESSADRPGWRLFAGTMFVLAAMLNGLWGAVAFANDDYFATDELLFGDLTMWGVFYVGVALTQAVTAAMIYLKFWGGRFVGLLLAVVSVLLALLSIGAYPLWSVIVLVIDGLVIYGLTVLPED